MRARRNAVGRVPGRDQRRRRRALLPVGPCDCRARSVSGSPPAAMTTTAAGAGAAVPPTAGSDHDRPDHQDGTNPFFVKMKEGAQAQAKKGQRQAAHRIGQPFKHITPARWRRWRTDDARARRASSSCRPTRRPSSRRSKGACMAVVDLSNPMEPRERGGRRCSPPTTSRPGRADRAVPRRRRRRRWASSPRSRCSTIAPRHQRRRSCATTVPEGLPGIKEGDPQIVGRVHPAVGRRVEAAINLPAAGQRDQRHLLDQRAVGLRRRERAKRSRQGPQGLHPGVRRRRL